MASEVDVTFPADNVKVDKSEMRAQMLIIYNEITALQARTGVAGAKAFYGFLEEQEVLNLVNLHTKSNLARDIAFGRVSLS
tara:strand:+ start:3067 stop:3309 length:243 start_codon:yes stop_codon:yes gene_type:complete